MQTNPNIGDTLVVAEDNSGASDSLQVGDIVTVTVNIQGDTTDQYAVIRVRKEGWERDIGAYLRAFQPADINAITELDAYKRAIVRKALEATTTYGWCSEAERVLREELGLGDFLPKEETVEVTVRVTVTRQPGETDRQVRSAAQGAVTITDGATGYVDRSEIVTE